MNITRERAKQLGTQFAAALALETNDEVIANGKHIVSLFTEAAKTEDDAERQQILECALAYNLRMFKKARAVVHMPSDNPLK